MICPPWNDKLKDHIKLDILTIGPTHIDPMFELTGCMRVTKILSISGVRNSDFCICENKGADQLCGNCTADQVLCFATWIVQSLNFLNPKFQVYSHLLWLYSLVCVGPGWKSRRQLFSQHSSYKTWWQGDSNEHPQHRLKELHQQGASNKCAQLMFI